LSKLQQPQSILDKLEKLHSNLGEIRNISINCNHLVNSNWPNQLGKIAISFFQIRAKWKSFIQIWAT